MTATIGSNTVVRLQYEVSNRDGEVLDKSAPGDDLTYLHGANSIIPGLEDALTGKQFGDRVQVTVEPESAYGPYQDELVQEMPLSAFPEPDNVEAGMQFNAQGAQGPLTLLVLKVTDESAVVDGNHPLAGQSLVFDVTVTEVRDATAEEIEHGHAH